jgi:very-short-patch-repair endonuclease
MLYYQKKLKANAQILRKNLTDAERKLWSRIRGKYFCGVQFYRQKPIGNYIVDFYAPAVKLVIELDGGQHFEQEHIAYDELRDAYLVKQGLKVLRFNNLQVLQSIDLVLEMIFQEINKVQKNPP